MDFVRIGKITGIHGLDGVVKIAPNTDNPQLYAEMQYLMLAEGESVRCSYEITWMQEHGNALLVQLEGILSAEAAANLKGLDVVIPADKLPEAHGGELYWHSIEGSEVIDEQGNHVGILDDYLETGTNDVFIIKDGKKSYMISNNENHVLKIDAKNKTLTVSRDGLVSEDL
jgi:16S rRNA processing protein RimM